MLDCSSGHLFRYCCKSSLKILHKYNKASADDIARDAFVFCYISHLEIYITMVMKVKDYAKYADCTKVDVLQWIKVNGGFGRGCQKTDAKDYSEQLYRCANYRDR